MLYCHSDRGQRCGRRRDNGIGPGTMHTVQSTTSSYRARYYSHRLVVDIMVLGHDLEHHTVIHTFVNITCLPIKQANISFFTHTKLCKNNLYFY